MWLSPAILGYDPSDNVFNYLYENTYYTHRELYNYKNIRVRHYYREHEAGRVEKNVIARSLRWHILEQQTMPKTVELSTERLYSEQVDNMTLNK